MGGWERKLWDHTYPQWKWFDDWRQQLNFPPHVYWSENLWELWVKEHSTTCQLYIFIKLYKNIRITVSGITISSTMFSKLQQPELLACKMYDFQNIYQQEILLVIPVQAMYEIQARLIYIYICCQRQGNGHILPGQTWCLIHSLVSVWSSPLYDVSVCPLMTSATALGYADF